MHTATFRQHDFPRPMEQSIGNPITASARVLAILPQRSQSSADALLSDEIGSDHCSPCRSGVAPPQAPRRNHARWLRLRIADNGRPSREGLCRTSPGPGKKFFLGEFAVLTTHHWSFQESFSFSVVKHSGNLVVVHGAHPLAAPRKTCVDVHVDRVLRLKDPALITTSLRSAEVPMPWITSGSLRMS